MTTYSNAGYAIMTPGDPGVTNAWGTVLNSNITLMDVNLNGVLTLSVAGNTNVVLTYANGAADQQRNTHFSFTGVLTGAINVLFPTARTRKFSVFNNTSGAFTLSIGANNGAGAPAGTTVAVPQGQAMELVSDGTNVTAAVTGQGLGALLSANNLSDVASVSASRTNLGLGTAATQNIGTFLQVANNLSDVASPSTSRTNLGLGTAAVQNIGTSGPTVPLLNTANAWSQGQQFAATNGIGSATNPWSVGQFYGFEALGGNAVAYLGGNSSSILIQNAYISAGNYKYSAAGPATASSIQANNGNILFITFPSGTGGNNATPATLGTFTNAGGLQIGAPTGGDKGAGALNAQTIFLNGTALTSQFLQISNNLSDVGSATTAKANLGIGTISQFNVFSTGQQALPGNGSTLIGVNHGLGGAPSFMVATLICQTGEGGYTAGDVVTLPGNDASNSHGFQPWANSTQVGGIQASSGIDILNKSTGGSFVITSANWKILIFAYR